VSAVVHLSFLQEASVTPRHGYVRLLLLTVTAVVAGCDQDQDRPSVPDPQEPEFVMDTGRVEVGGVAIRIECPNISPEDRDPEARGSAAVHDTTVAAPLAGAIQYIPEYHDCQRLVSRSTPRRFGPLVAIFANEILGAISPEDYQAGVAVAQIFNFSRVPYGPLNIQPGYNCLYLRLDGAGAWHARLKSLLDDSMCGTLSEGEWGAAGPLTVRRVTPSSDSTHYPPVARWDRDPVNHIHYIGIKCLTGWCEIGVGNFVSSADHLHPDHTGRIKGWYDEQRLAEPPQQTGGPPLVPTVRARIVPVPRLDTLEARHYSCTFPCTTEGGWVLVATTYMDSTSDFYRSKLNFVPGANGNRIYLRRVVNAGEERWQSRVISADDSIAYFRTLRVDHTPLHASANTPMVPPTARWHWREGDETTWNRCDLGCCETTDQRIDPNVW
jgi:hypothetical protein